MKIKSKCPQCGEILTSNWKLSPVYVTCKNNHSWHPRQDILAAVYVNKSVTEKEYLNA